MCLSPFSSLKPETLNWPSPTDIAVYVPELLVKIRNVSAAKFTHGHICGWMLFKWQDIILN